LVNLKNKKKRLIMSRVIQV